MTAKTAHKRYRVRMMVIGALLLAAILVFIGTINTVNTSLTSNVLVPAMTTYRDNTNPPPTPTTPAPETTSSPETTEVPSTTECVEPPVEFSIGWNPPPAGEDRAGVDIYVSTTSGDTGNPSEPDYTTNKTHFKVTGLTCGIRYYFYLRARNSAGIWSAPTSWPITFKKDCVCTGPIMPPSEPPVDEDPPTDENPPSPPIINIPAPYPGIPPIVIPPPPPGRIECIPPQVVSAVLNRVIAIEYSFDLENWFVLYEPVPDDFDYNTEINKFKSSWSPKVFIRAKVDFDYVCIDPPGASTSSPTLQSSFLGSTSSDSSVPSVSWWSRLMSYISSLFSSSSLESDVIGSVPPEPPVAFIIDQKMRNVQVLSRGTSPGDTLLISGDLGIGTVLDLSTPLQTSVPEGTYMSITAIPGPNSTFQGWTGGCQEIIGNTCSFLANKAKGVTARFTPLVNTINGVCGTTINSCAAGVPVDQVDSSTLFRWECSGLKGGTNRACTLNKPIDGTCGTTNNTCTAGTSVDQTDTATQYKWACNGQYGGTNLSCTLNKPINGTCGTTNSSCIAGTFLDKADTTTQYLWSCNGVYGGATSSCTINKPINGTCGTTNNVCIAGASVDQTDTATQYKWACNGQYGGTNLSCTLNKPVNGTCGTTNNSCIAGTFLDKADTTTQYLWSCNGVYGGATSSCSKSKSTLYSIKAIKVGPGNIYRGAALFSSGTFPLGTTITLTAKPTTGYTFSGWSGCTSVSGANCIVSINASKTVTATFK